MTFIALLNVHDVDTFNVVNVDDTNDCLVRGELDRPGLFPHLEGLAAAARVFEPDFGLAELPMSPGILVIRGPRQYGKSTWLEGRLRASAEELGPGSALFVDAQELADGGALRRQVRRTIGLFRPGAPVRRLFIDEITAVAGWETALKALVDRGDLRDVLVVTTGSRCTDLRRGVERLPGRRGRLDRTSWLFTPVPFAEFVRVCGRDFPPPREGEEGGAMADDAVLAYLLAGGCPLALSEMAARGRLPEWTVEVVRDWIDGELARSGRARAPLVQVMEVLTRSGGSPIGQTRLAREAGLANNTVAAGYVEQLADLMCVGIQQAWDPARRVPVARRRAKYPFINTLAAVAWHPARPRTVEELRARPAQEQGTWLEWLVAQEVWRRSAMEGDPFPERLLYWHSKHRELDFVLSSAGGTFVEVKRGRASPSEHAWFAPEHPAGRLLVVTRTPFRTDRVRGLTARELLLARDWG